MALTTSLVLPAGAAVGGDLLVLGQQLPGVLDVRPQHTAVVGLDPFTSLKGYCDTPRGRNSGQVMPVRL